MESRSRTSRFTHWSLRDSVHVNGNTDHWTKLKVRLNSSRRTRSEEALNVHPETENGMTSKEPYQFGHERAVTQLPFVASSTSSQKNQNVLPDKHLSVTISKNDLKKHWLDNCYQRRARGGFQYWLINRPTPTSFGKSGIGSYKMVLGMGMAPRT